MKKKPSLLDIEIFVQKRADEKQHELSQIEADSGAVVNQKNNIVNDIKEDGKNITYSKEDRVKIEENKTPGDINIKENDRYTKNDINLDENRLNENSKRAMEYNQSPIMIDERLTSIIEITDSQRDDMNRLKQDMFKLKEQLRVYHSFLSNQQKKILELEKSILEKNLSGDYSNKGVLDSNYTKLLLKNIVWLKEEKDFSSNDVARLFRAEGFETPQPYENWDEKVINTLYNEAKKSFL